MAPAKKQLAEELTDEINMMIGEREFTIYNYVIQIFQKEVTSGRKPSSSKTGFMTVPPPEPTNAEINPTINEAKTKMVVFFPTPQNVKYFLYFFATDFFCHLLFGRSRLGCIGHDVDQKAVFVFLDD